ncbi:MAG: hypothetical protein COA57_02575 [Flavobacteriales bacterium]|nr:MAG: hypothetical protein COA57_02575 [Flavobacteriales bacterium]
MKKKLLFASLFIVIATFSIAQVCTPDPTYVNAGSTGIYPTSTEGIDSGTVGMAYTQTFTVIVPLDTTIDVPPIGPVSGTVNHITLENVTGLPTGITYTCDNTPCQWQGDSVGCFVLSGTPSQSGTFSVALEVSANVTALGQTSDIPAQTWDTYTLVILDTGGTSGIILNKGNEFKLLQNQPNPFAESTQIKFNVATSSNLKLKIYNLLGEEVHAKTIASKAGLNTIDFSRNHLKNGLYFYALSNGITTLTNRMVISE